MSWECSIPRNPTRVPETPAGKIDGLEVLVILFITLNPTDGLYRAYGIMFLPE